MDTKTENTTGLAMQAFDFEEQPLRTILKDGEPWFVARDVGAVLSITNIRQQLVNLDEDEKGVSLTYTLGGAQKATIISESGLYTLILRCDDAIKPGTTAHRFRKWVTSEVLPTLRKAGAYSLAQSAEREAQERRVERLRGELAQRVRSIEGRTGYAADGALNKMPMNRVNTVARLGRVQLDACKFLWELESGGERARLNWNGTRVVEESDD